MTEDQQRAVDQIKKLMPYLGFREKQEWIDTVEDWFPSREEALLELTGATSRQAS